MKWLLAFLAVLWAGVIWLGDADRALERHAAIMGMLNLIGFLILDKLDSWRAA